MAKVSIVDPVSDYVPSDTDSVIYDSDLTGWIIDKCESWEDARNSQYQERWKEYYRLWRGQHAGPEDKIRQYERSKLIAPALQQAIEGGVSEMEETIFHRKRWFDLEDDVREIIFKQIIEENAQQIAPEQLEQIASNIDTRLVQVTDQLLEDFETRNVNQAISEILLNAALYGTGIGKITVEQKPRRVPITGSMGTTSDVIVQKDLHVNLVPVDPNEFVIDIASNNLKDALGMAHMYTVPRHEILQKQAKGIYNNVPVVTLNSNLIFSI